MRKLFLAGAIVICLSFLAAPAAAVMTFGIHGGIDFNGQEAVKLSTELPNGDELSIDRDELSSPMMGGLHIFVDITPIIDMEFGLEGGTSKYHVAFNHTPSDGELARFADDLRFWRLSAYGSAKVGVLELPLIKGYVGGGLGLHWISELISRDLLAHKIIEEGSGDLSPAEIVERQRVSGIHFLLGARVDPSVLPFAVSAELRYHMISENDFGDETHRFASFAVGVEFGY